MTDRDENGVDISDIELDRSKKPIFGLFPEDDKTASECKCINCGEIKLPKERATWTTAGQREWYISSTCEPCFDTMFADEDDNGADWNPFPTQR